MIFSAVQPSGGSLHLGNYLGAVKKWVALQDAGKCVFCIVDMHALTSGSAETLSIRANTLSLLASYIACGIDPGKAVVFLQSSVPEHAELCWILGCLTPVGWLNRMTQFKDKSRSDSYRANLGLYSYPVLMAADILLYKADLVPVGNDQKQHLELAQSIARTFNTIYGVDFFCIPEAMPFDSAARIMSLKTGTKKMSKSDPSDFSRINLSDDNDVIALKIKKATTDSATGFCYEGLNQRPEVNNLVNIFAALSDSEPREVCVRFTNSSNKDFKDALTELLIERISPIRTKTRELLDDPGYLNSILSSGNEQARSIAGKNLREVKEIIGLHSV
ncbi:tryptophan--tRNA ligase [Anaplasma phagocytophilum str. Norway variant2]|uniref:Tryptophan--tRNA ligase n=1 Tax=Anaplasma phagocytophilum str. Norway variant2 TaxID=1392507 RepID=A0A161IJ11_ANAPH|nr:tryptophan--tRNA ligase [Anaplasma phagocytophilum]ANC33865.1 tryptophan--tRNA ligase [Anaplasma phagocytophilum str. Norway variant2]